jgi:hypothetical protein
LHKNSGFGGILPFVVPYSLKWIRSTVNEIALNDITEMHFKAVKTRKRAAFQRNLVILLWHRTLAGAEITFF